jgi:hypothetical protein
MADFRLTKFGGDFGAPHFFGGLKFSGESGVRRRLRGIAACGPTLGAVLCESMDVTYRTSDNTTPESDCEGTKHLVNSANDKSNWMNDIHSQGISLVAVLRAKGNMPNNAISEIVHI